MEKITHHHFLHLATKTIINSAVTKYQRNEYLELLILVKNLEFAL